MVTTQAAPAVRRVLVATDRSQSADHAVRWAANLAASYGAELVLLQILVQEGDGESGAPTHEREGRALESLAEYARGVAGSRGIARVVASEDPAGAILRAVDDERADVVVLGNVGMRGRKQFLLSNIPNRITHNARCTVMIVNTAPSASDGRVGADAPSGRDSGASVGDPALLGRAWRIGRVMARAGVRDLLSKRQADAGQARDAARRVRAALDELGPTFAKLGQILSTRPDLLPPEFIDELATLQDHVTPLTEAEVVAVMERELGIPWEDVFGSIDPHPLAAGTIAQVHRATLESGERVVVKVQRPTAERDILQDLELLELFGERAAGRPAFRQVIDFPAMIKHLAESLRRELDFRREAGNLKRMREVLAPFSRLAVPSVYEEYSTARLLVMEEVQGVPVRQAPPGPARSEAARQLLEAYYHQVLAEGFFHADPHPGNMKWWNDTIYFLDLGMVGEVEEEARSLIVMLLLAFSQRDAEFLAEVVLMLSPAGDGASIDIGAFRADLADLVARYSGRSLKELQLGPLLQEVTRISARHRVRVPTSLTLTGKAFAQMQLIAAELEPTLDPFSVAESYVLRNTLRRLGGYANPRTLFYETQKLQRRVGRIVDAVESTLGTHPGAGLNVRFKGTEQLEAAISRSTRRLSLALGLSGSLVVAALAATSPHAPRWAPKMLAAASGALVAGLLVERPRSNR